MKQKEQEAGQEMIIRKPSKTRDNLSGVKGSSEGHKSETGVSEFTAKHANATSHTKNGNGKGDSVTVTGEVVVAKPEYVSECGKNRKSSRKHFVENSLGSVSSNVADPLEEEKKSIKEVHAGEMHIEEVNKKEKKLLVEIKEGGTGKDLVGKILEILPQGLIGSQRKPQDGNAYFGSSEPDPTGHVNDFSQPEADSGLGSKHFKIFYDRKDNEYYIQDLGEGTGTFVKIERESAIQSGGMISFGTYHLIVTLKQSQENPREESIAILLADGEETKES